MTVRSGPTAPFILRHPKRKLSLSMFFADGTYRPRYLAVKLANLKFVGQFDLAHQRMHILTGVHADMRCGLSMKLVLTHGGFGCSVRNLAGQAVKHRQAVRQRLVWHSFGWRYRESGRNKQRQFPVRWPCW